MGMDMAPRPSIAASGDDGVPGNVNKMMALAGLLLHDPNATHQDRHAAH